MDIDELTQYGLAQEILEIWKASESKRLLPVQAAAVAQGLLSGKSLLVSAPTSSGKTFLREIAACKQALQQHKVIYLAPHKAIVDEKYHDFCRKYRDYGIQVVASSSDHYEYDQDIPVGRFDIGIFTYEKLAMFLVTSPVVISSCGLVIVDEIQMLGDPGRGADLELLLTKILLLSKGAQILALSASLDTFDGLDQWLGTQGLLIKERPIELREGIYTSDGVFTYREWNTKRLGQERFPASAPNDNDAMLNTLVEHLVAEGEQVLIFRKDKRSTIETAKRIARRIKLGPAAKVIDSLQALEETAARESLIECLRHGVAFHNADLVSEERRLIESSYREGQIRVICSTSTLAMGVNLPTRTSIIADPIKWSRDEEAGGYHDVPITVGEYRNMSGRAGRYRFGDEFGRSILLAGSALQRDRYQASLIGGTTETIASRLGKQPIAHQVLDVIASGLGTDEAEIVAFMMNTFAGFRTWKAQGAKDAVSKTIQSSIQQCVDLGLVQRDGSGKLAPTDLGRVCAGKKIGLDTFALLKEWLAGPLPASDFTALYFSAQAPELSRIGFNMSTAEFQSDRYIQFIRENSDALGVPGQILELMAGTNQEKYGYDRTKQLKMVLVAKWAVEGKQYRDLEKRLLVGAGSIRNVCEHLAWILDSASSLAPLFGRSRGETDCLITLAETLRYGVPAPMLSIARLRVPGMNRTHLMRLMEHGIQTVDKVLDTDPAALQGVISRKLSTGLQERAQESIRDTVERRKRQQVLRLQKIGVDISILVALYEKTGKELEVTLGDLFTPPFCGCLYERIGKQREGEPDGLLHLSDGGVIAFSVTARENQNVSMKKAGEIIAGAARFRPVARVVVGRPDFHELAISNASEIVAEGTNFKLLPISVLAEMYVRVVEGKMTTEQVIAILKEKTGYLSLDSLT